MTLAEAIYNGSETLSQHGIENARLDAELLLCRSLNRNRAWIVTHSKESLEDEARKGFETLVNRRAKREPFQYIVGVQEFWGLDFTVTPDVLIPRPETELIIERALAIEPDRRRPLNIADLCTGSGCIAISLATERDQARIFAADKSVKALVVARENARIHGVSERVRFLQGDLFEPLEELDLRARMDIIVSNPPYVPDSVLPSLQPEVRDFEPLDALAAGVDGTVFHRRIIDRAPEFFKQNGALIMEMGLGQAEMLVRLVNETGQYQLPEIFKDLAGIERVIVARKK